MGEKIAEKFLRKKGYQIIERNFTTKWGEIDLICSKDKVLIFVEVKLKIGDQFGTPEEMVNKRKINQVKRIAETYRTNLEQKRIDVVAIVLRTDKKTAERISHYKSVTA